MPDSPEPAACGGDENLGEIEALPDGPAERGYRGIQLAIVGRGLCVGLLLFAFGCSAAHCFVWPLGANLRVIEEQAADRELDRAFDQALAGLSRVPPDATGTVRSVAEAPIGSAGPDVWADARGLIPRPATRDLGGVLRDLKALHGRRMAALASYRLALQSAAWGLIAVSAIACAVVTLVGVGIALRTFRWAWRLGAEIGVLGRVLGIADDRPSGGWGVFSRLGPQLESMSSRVGVVMELLQSREKELQHAERLSSLGRVSAEVAHELRNSLFALKALVQVNREEFESWGLPSEELKVIEQELRGMEGQIQSLLGLARQTGEGNRVADLTDAVRHAVALLRGRSLRQQVRILTDFPDEAVVVPGNPEQIQQVVLNLLRNSLDVVPAGGWIEGVVRRAACSHVELIVRDNGPGIDPAVLPRIFESFVTTKPNGLGIGLSVASQVARSLGGSLSATNSAGGGACFCLRLPRARDGCPATPPTDALEKAAV